MQERINEYEPLWGDWYVDGLIGEGSFGKVYKVKRVEFGETYYSAVKIITIPQNESEVRHAYSEGMDSQSVKSYFQNFVKDLINEIRLMSNLKGLTNIVSLEDHKIIERKDSIGWDILIRMELLKSLQEYLYDHTLTQSEIIRLGIDICRALELCQKYNIIHRDIKPDNIFVSPHGDFKLGDFGIARQVERTMAGLSKKGTFSYMAPEVYKGQAYNSTVDIYSLGLVLYRFLNNNRTPFLPDYPVPITHNNREEALIKRMRGEALPKPLNAEGSIGEIILRACAYSPKERYENPGQMREALEAAQHRKKEPEEYKIHDESKVIEPTQTIYENLNIMHMWAEGLEIEDMTESVKKDEADDEEKPDGVKSVNKATVSSKIDSKVSNNSSGRLWKKISFGAGICVVILIVIMIIFKPQITGIMSDKANARAEIARKSEVKGNTPGNINNGGMCTTQDGYIYYNNIVSGSKLYKIHNDGTGNLKLSDDRAQYINVVGDWIYYSNLSDNMKLYRIRTDGTGRKKLIDEKAAFVNVVGDWIYFSNLSNYERLYRIHTNGTKLQKLNDDVTAFINISEDWIYYINQSDENKLYMVRFDGTDRKCIISGNFNYINVVGDRIYYSNRSDGNKLYKINTGGMLKEKLNDEDSKHVNVAGDWIYYLDAVDNICKISTDGGLKEIINNVPSKDINVVGDWIYYVNKATNLQYRMSTSGSNKELVN